MQKFSKLRLAALASITLTGAALANPDLIRESERSLGHVITPMGLIFDMEQATKGGVLRITGPNDFFLEETFHSSGGYDLLWSGLGLDDGLYNYEFVVWPEAEGESTEPMSGAFTISKGAPLDQSVPERVFNTIISAGSAEIQGSLCVGNDCVDAENYGFDTLRLKENNLRFHFDDTSGSASFPSNDWRLIANDSDNGGASYFAIEDSTAGRIPFRVEAGAPLHALYVDDGGRVGFGTSTPVVDNHIASGNTPTVRLEQNGTSGFTPQTWDMAGNETNFFIRDVSNGSQLPLRVRPGANTDSLEITSTGRVVMKGAESAGGRDILRLERSGNVALILKDNAIDAEWGFGTANGSGNFNIALTGAGVLLELTQAGQLLINGTNVNVPDYVFEEDYKLMSLQQLESFINTNGHLPGVTSAKQVAAAGTVDMLGMQMQLLEKVEELTLYTLQQEERIRKLTASMEAAKSEKDLYGSSIAPY